MQNAILAPAAALAVWSIIMLLWMVSTRLPALAKLKIPTEQSRGGRGSDLEGRIPPIIQWKAHNYNHLMEQPTVFYAVVVVLALAGGSQLDAWLGWAYVAVRVVHSFWQSLVNTIPIRIVLFAVSSTILGIMAVRALMLTMGVA